MAAYYNEIDAYAAEWLRNLIKAGHIVDGEVDTRSIVDVSPDELREFTQCHFFAGIAGWSHALRLAGWEDERQIWTGSCPCQPFSVAGQGKGTDDPRHLWPHFFRLIRGCRPKVVMGEQVAGAAGYGWLDGVRSDLESESYAIEGVDIPACSANAPHIRSRLYWVAYAESIRREYGVLKPRNGLEGILSEGSGNKFADNSIGNNMGDTQSKGLEGHTGLLSNGDKSRRLNTQQDGQAVRPGIGYGNDMAIPNIDGYDGERGDAPVQGGYRKNDGVSVGSGGDICPDLADTNSGGCLQAGEWGALDTIHPGELYDGMSTEERDPCGIDMADASISGWRQRVENAGRVFEGNRTKGKAGRSAKHGDAFDMADTESSRRQHGILKSRDGHEGNESKWSGSEFTDNGIRNMADTESRGRGVQQPKDNWEASGEVNAPSDDCPGSIGAARIEGDMANSASEGLEGSARASLQGSGNGSPSNSYWDNAIWLNGADGKTRRAQPDICLLAHGVPARVGKLRAYGNAIVPQIAAEVIKAFMEK